MKSAACCICRSARRATISTAAIVRARICSANRWCASTRTRASASGTTKSSITACGITIWPSPPMLVTITVGGKKIDAVVQLTKQGFAFVFDRVTGKPVWPIEERAGPGERRARRAGVADAAVSDQASGVQPAGRDARRCLRSDAGTESRSAGRDEEVPAGSAVHASIARRARWGGPESSAERTGAAARSIPRPGCCTSRPRNSAGDISREEDRPFANPRGSRAEWSATWARRRRSTAVFR